MKLNILLTLSMLTLSTIGFPQSNIQGRINDVDSGGIAFANVLLLNHSDSMLIKGAVTNESGNFVLTDIAVGLYNIESSMVGYSKSFLPTIHLTEPGDILLEPMILMEDLNELEEVTVKATKPLNADINVCFFKKK